MPSCLLYTLTLCCIAPTGMSTLNLTAVYFDHFSLLRDFTPHATSDSPFLFKKTSPNPRTEPSRSPINRCLFYLVGRGTNSRVAFQFLLCIATIPPTSYTAKLSRTRSLYLTVRGPGKTWWLGKNQAKTNWWPASSQLLVAPPASRIFIESPLHSKGRNRRTQQICTYMEGQNDVW